MHKKLFYMIVLVLAVHINGTILSAQLHDDFNTPHDYLVNGVAGTGWDGFIGLGSGETVNSLNADTGRPGQLYIASVNGRYQEPWEPLGPFLYKMVSGDFVATVKVTDYQDVMHNNCGIMARASKNPDEGDAGCCYCQVSNASGATKSDTGCITVLPEAWSMKQAALMTAWADRIDPNNVLPEYPRPQLVREEWLNLNGLWQFEAGNAGDPVPVGQNLTRTILVPYPIESAISGIMEHHEYGWYRREFEIPPSWVGKNILLNFEAADWEAEVFVNGQSVGIHRGGYAPFQFDITGYLEPNGLQELIVKTYDPTDTKNIARGKQTCYPGGIWYTSVSGIWGTVWLEPVNAIYVDKLVIVPDVDQQKLKLTVNTSGTKAGLSVTATCSVKGTEVSSVTGNVNTELSLGVDSPLLWSPEHPVLYDLRIYLKDGQTIIDTVDSYFGMRKIQVQQFEGITRMALNGEFAFQIGPLDQGYWPDGLYRAPTDKALKWDLERIKDFGFNMIRKHVKVEPRRWYYWADKLGLMVWQDMPSMRNAPNSEDKVQFEIELNQLIEDFRNHPCIILWVLFNEGWGQYDTERLTNEVMSKDASRLVSCASGWADYPVGHIIDYHGYPSPVAPSPTASRAAVSGEYGGIAYRLEGHLWSQDAWGYTQVYSSQELLNLYESLMGQVVNYKESPGTSAAVYTQITDVEAEINGLITYDRRIIKADLLEFRRINLKRYAHTAEVVPTSIQEGQSWRYTTTTPEANWYTAGYDDSAWGTGPGGFGTAGTPGAIVRTTWNTSDIWLRREFALPEMTAEEIDQLFFSIHHDEDAEVYLNGVPAASVTGYTITYTQLAINQAGKDALIPGGTGLLAVHCHQTVGGQYIDVGISFYSSYCAQGLKGDFNNDCKVDMQDLVMFVSEWLSYEPYPDCLDIVEALRYDLNDDCKVNMVDFAGFASEWLACGFYPDCF